MKKIVVFRNSLYVKPALKFMAMASQAGHQVVFVHHYNQDIVKRIYPKAKEGWRKRLNRLGRKYGMNMDNVRVDLVKNHEYEHAALIEPDLIIVPYKYDKFWPEYYGLKGVKVFNVHKNFWPRRRDKWLEENA